MLLLCTPTFLEYHIFKRERKKIDRKMKLKVKNLKIDDACLNTAQ